MIEVGEYVRTDKGKIVKIDKEKINLQMLKFLDVEYGQIVKRSKNIIDLIEVGDYVNGEQVVGKDNNCILLLTDKGQTYLRNIFESKYIKSIVTKEMFASAEYRVETD